MKNGALENRWYHCRYGYGEGHKYYRKSSSNPNNLFATGNYLYFVPVMVFMTRTLENLKTTNAAK